MKILIASGGSGGHIFPAVSLAKKLSESGVNIIFVASRRRLDKKLLHASPYKKIFLSANPMPYKFGLRVPIFFVKLILDMFQAAYILIRHRPDVIVGFGGYTAGALLLLARAAKIKTVIHEQNVVPGRTNKFLGRFAGQIAVSFAETEKYFKNKNAVFTGNPLREESLKECRGPARDGFGLEADKFTLLVMGGSQGARSLNHLVAESLGLLPQKEKGNIQIVHIAGVKDFSRVRDFYSKNKIAGKVFGFVENINEAYSACDAAISCSGAACIFELAAFAKPMVLIPYPGKKNNQRFNAAFFAKEGACIYKEENQLRKEELKDLIVELMNDPGKAKSLSENAKKLSVTDGAERLAKLVLNF